MVTGKSISKMFSVLLALTLLLALTAPTLAAPGDTTRVSVDSSGAQGEGSFSFTSGGRYVAVSADGCYVAFESDATNLVSEDTNGMRDVFVHDLTTGATTRVSVGTGISGAQGNGESFYPSPSISDDGRYVAFESSATNLVSGDTNGMGDVFVRDTIDNTTTRVSVASNGAQGDNGSYTPSISADGRYVVFESSATNLVSGDTNFVTDTFVHDLTTGATTRVSVDSNGVQRNGGPYSWSSLPSISADGHYVAFESNATNLVSGDTNGMRDVFVHNLTTGATTRVSVGTGISGAQGDNDSYTPSISADGRYVAFESYATNLVSGDTNGKADIFVRDTQTNITTLVSVDSSGAQGNDHSNYSSISTDGRYVAFGSSATNLVSGDTSGIADIFVRDTQTNITTRASVDSSGAQANYNSYSPSITADGRYVAFTSFASNLVSGDTNGAWDIFVHENDFTPAITLLDPNSAAKGGPDFTLTITGKNFVDTSIVQWNGATRPRTFVSSTVLTATITAADIANSGVAYITVFNPAPGGGTSNPQAFFINNTGAQIISSNTASGTNPSATTGGSTGITANATGGGTVTVGIYNSNPGGTPSFSSSDAYQDVHVAPDNTFTSLTIVDFNLNGGTQVYWWNGTTWALASNQSYNSSTLCVTITVNNSTSPSLSQLTGTPFGAADGFKLFLPLILR